jgi:hypothetical protein
MHKALDSIPNTHTHTHTHTQKYLKSEKGERWIMNFVIMPVITKERKPSKEGRKKGRGRKKK